MSVQELTKKIQQETEKIIIGKSEKIRLVIMAVLAEGHVLLNDLPGVGKTTLVKTVSKALGCDHGRIQFVPDMLPSDIIGMRIFNQKTGDFELKKGPVMTNILLADEINRAIPRTQSALLEAMEERQISIDTESYKLPEPFVVLATQNPVEMESTFKLPAAQMDRFLIQISMGYPSPEEEREMLHRLGDEIPFDKVESVTNSEHILKARGEVNNVHVSDAVADYIIAVCDATRNHSQLMMGASPRAARALYKAVKAWAAMDGRDYAVPDDVKALAHCVLDHRLVVENSARFSGVREADILEEILNRVPGAPAPEEIVNEG